MVPGAIWEGSFLFAKVAVAEIPPFIRVFLTVFIACAVLPIVFAVSKHRFPLNWKLLASFAMMGLLNNAIPFSLLFWEQPEISAGLASILNATRPAFTFILAVQILKQESIQARRIVGVLIGFAGVIVM